MKVIVTGAQGQLGLGFQKGFTGQGIPMVALDYTTCDITNRKQVEKMLDSHQPSVLINCAAYNLVDEAQDDPTKAFEVNSNAVKMLAQACLSRAIKLVHFSTDYVFDGKKKSPYMEEDAAHPLNVYGASKYEGETALRTVMAEYLLLRTSWVYGEGKQNFLYKVSQWATKGPIKVSDDEVSVPTSVEDIVTVTLKALHKGITGTYHLTSGGHASRYEWAKVFLKACGLTTQVIPVPMSHFQLKAVRPSFSAMSNVKISKELAIEIPSWQVGVEKFARSLKASQ